jgi:hypothetical protein
MADCPSQAKNRQKCTCTYDCERRGRCCECVDYHRRMGEIPGCFFTAKGEKLWDRSVAAFVRDRS